MLNKLPKQPQLEMFKTVLISFISPDHELCLLGKKIAWVGLEKEFAPLFGTVGIPSIPNRTIVGLLLLKQMYNLGNETVVDRYVENPYWHRSPFLNLCHGVFYPQIGTTGLSVQDARFRRLTSNLEISAKLPAKNPSRVLGTIKLSRAPS